jgi:hypothetical protein
MGEEGGDVSRRRVSDKRRPLTFTHLFGHYANVDDYLFLAIFANSTVFCALPALDPKK